MRARRSVPIGDDQQRAWAGELRRLRGVEGSRRQLANLALVVGFVLLVALTIVILFV